MASNHEFKLQRAQRHLDDLDGEIAKWLDRNFETIIHEKDANRTDYYSAYIVMEPYPVAFPLLVGDFLHNARGSLDHLAYALAERHSGTPLTNDIAKDSEFPIFNTPRMDEIRKKIRGIDPRAQTIIQSLQPYQNRQGSDVLWILRELSNVDKHRLLLTGNVANLSGWFDPRRCTNFKPGAITVHPGHLEGKTKIATYQGWPHDPRKEMYVGFTPFIEVVFDCGSSVDGVSVYLTLFNIIRHIERITASLEPFL